MRLPLLLSIALALALGCGSEPLSSARTGAGGSGMGTGGAAGGTSPAAGGAAGATSTPTCSRLVAEYRSALGAAETCRVGAPGQCQRIAAAGLPGCSCPTYVTDDSALSTIAQDWAAAGCSSPSAPPCNVSCVQPANTTCVAVDGGSAGTCSAAAANVDANPRSCAALAAEYATALTAARSCTPGAGGQCSQQVPDGLSPCPSCFAFVTDRTVLDAIRAQWEAAGCADRIVLCIGIDCQPATGAACLPTDAGGAACPTGVQGPGAE